MAKPPSSPQRKADFRETARAINRAATNPTQAIASALERAYRRGWEEAHDGAPPEPDADDALPWLQIPPRPRAAFARIGSEAQHLIHGRLPWRSRREKPPLPMDVEQVAKCVMLIYSGPSYPSAARGQWHLYVRHEPFNDGWERADSYGETTINPLIRLGLIEVADSIADPQIEKAGWVSAYGLTTWLTEALRMEAEGQWSGYFG